MKNLVKVVLIADPETGMELEIARSANIKRAHKFPSTMRVRHVSRSMIDWFRGTKSGYNAAQSRLADMFDKPDSSNDGGGEHE